MTEVDFESITAYQRYKLMASLIVPRPIALVTTLGPTGVVNAAPFSMFNMVGEDPPILMISINRLQDGRLKDTAANILRSGEFVVHISDEAMAQKMHGCGEAFPSEVSELAAVGPDAGALAARGAAAHRGSAGRLRMRAARETGDREPLRLHRPHRAACRARRPDRYAGLAREPARLPPGGAFRRQLLHPQQRAFFAVGRTWRDRADRHSHRRALSPAVVTPHAGASGQAAALKVANRVLRDDVDDRQNKDGRARVRTMNRRQILQTATLMSPSVFAAARAQGTESTPATPATRPLRSLSRDSALSARDLREDLALVDRVYRALHPGLTRYQTQEQWRHAVAALDAHWAARAEHRLDAAYRGLSLLLARIRCGHSYANFYNQRQHVVQALFEGRDKLPLTFTWIGARMVVTGGALPAGTEVLSIDGMPAGQTLTRLLPMVRSDGHNDAKRRSLLSVDAREGYETFDVFHPVTFGARDRFVLEVLEPGARRRRLELPAIDLAQRQAMSPRKPAAPSDASPPWTLTYDADGNALLSMTSWALYDSKWEWAAWLEQKLDEIVEAKAPRLLIDLRRNEGGLDCGDAILARCIERPLVLREEERLVRYRRVPDELNSVLDTWDDGFRDWGDRARPSAARPGFFTLVPTEASAEAGGQSIDPRGSKFRGKLRVLTGSANSSATFRFASLVREHGLGRTIGAATGGNQRGINGGAFFFVRLPGTGLEVDLPLIGYFPRGPLRPDAGLEPDVAAVETIDDIVAGRDRALEMARRA